MTLPIVLASSSPYRRILLERLGLPFTAHSPGVDETPLPGEPSRSLAERLAVCKAGALSEDYGEHLIIGSDQVATLDKQVLGKPGDFDTAREQLRRQSGQTLLFYTSVVALDSANGQYRLATDATKATFRQLSDDEISRYLDREQPYDCAGSFKMEGLGIALFTQIETLDPTALMGLPLIALARLLRQFKVPVI
jgi:MAF protein